MMSGKVFLVNMGMAAVITALYATGASFYLTTMVFVLYIARRMVL